MSIGHKIRHWNENFQGNSVWFKPEMRLKRTLKFGKKSFVEILLRISCTRWCKPERQPGKLWISLKIKIELQREGNFQKAMYCRKSKQFVCFFLGNTSFDFKAFMLMHSFCLSNWTVYSLPFLLPTVKAK